MSGHSKSSPTRALVAVALLLGATSLAQAASPVGRVLVGEMSPTVHRSGAATLSLWMTHITAKVAQKQPLDQPRQAMTALQDLSARTREIDANEEARSRVAFEIHWRNDPDFVSPKIASLARNFRRNGLPIVHLWQSGRNLLAIGLNPHGKPGIYFTQKIPD